MPKKPVEREGSTFFGFRLKQHLAEHVLGEARQRFGEPDPKKKAKGYTVVFTEAMQDRYGEKLKSLHREPRLHSLRHRWATRLGEDPRVTVYQLMAWGGWRSLSVVQRYVHPRTQLGAKVGPLGSTLWPMGGPRRRIAGRQK